MPPLLSQLSSRAQSLLSRGAGSRIVSGFLMVALLTVGSKAVSFLKDAAIARQFGTGDALDAFLVSFGLLTFLAALVGGGLPESFLPVYVESAHRGIRRRALRLAVQSSILHAATLGLLAFAVYFIAPYFVSWATRGFNPEKQALAVSLLRQLLPFMVCFGLSYQFSAWLRADKRFIVATSAPTLIPMTIIGLLIYDGDRATVATLVTGTVAGAALHLMVLLGTLLHGLPRQRRFWKGCWKLWEPKLGRICRHTAHFLFAGGIFSSSVVVDQTMAAWLPPGSVAVLGYTEKICGIILAVTVAPSCDVLFPYFADKVARRDWLGVKHQLWVSAGAILALALPAVLMLCWLAPWVVSLLFQRGSFTSEDTLRVAEVLRFAALQIPFYIVGSLASRVVVAMQATHFIIWISVIGLIGNAGLNWVLMKNMGAAGIALSTVLIQMTSAVLACLYVLRQIKDRLKNG
ncbi:murein biosynthesis integral membrane protein MurJ [Prosthecobacter dejongeii]|uniref:Putative peptidoglycan lipid II flippase n=1 Tax=Prosthecobacter dejongeii TaxID=48465 RepID=A0A7W8DQE2_9BACT|nr:lipid II flippase MurJ [Prosthecobacter dejongeii]MBB5037851.1 putative peptidoglycan lipid II flippase [Prosthecobacter dejongeii]